MLKMLLPVDGSEASGRAVEEFVKRLDWYSEKPEIHLLNVRIPLTGNVSMFVSKEEIGDYYREEGLKGMQQARDYLEERGIAYRHHIVVGEIVPMILQFAEEIKCDQVVIGPRGLGAVKGLLLGSVASKLIQLSTVPVLLLK
ncbi:universal stress protein [Nitrosomonas sp.]|uniref:universal stress protein n=1 Tax=Nitrosomonas sp. TaxID=42353 RepID=UPI0026003C0D|nr:universal stress protein [Nitrosomonas sp.]